MSTTFPPQAPRYLGAAFVFQFATSLAAGLLSASVLSGGISEVLTNVAGNRGQMQASIVLELLTSVGILVMTSLLYVVLRDQDRSVALVALALWVAEAVMLAVKTLGLYALVAQSQSYPAGGTTAGSFVDEKLGSLSWGLSQHAGDIGMLFFCSGALLWYSTLARSRIVPRLLALWGLLAVLPVLVATLMLVWDRGSDPSKALYAAYVPFELVLGLWLLVKGADARSGPAVRRAIEDHPGAGTHGTLVPSEREPP